MNIHIHKIFMWSSLLIITILIIVIYRLDFTQPDVKWGVSFSAPYAENELGLNWQETYLAILKDLNVSHIRLSAYWNEIQANSPDEYDFSDIDWQINHAKISDVKIILAVGRRLPRWPECHDPQWLTKLNPDKQHEAQLKFVNTIIERYKDEPQIEAWQIENEPFLSTFGICPPPDKNLLQQEIALAKNLTDKPIIITDSGELSSWLPAAKSGGNILGTTLYRVVHNKYFGYWHWPLPPSFYTAKAWLVKYLTDIEKVTIMELQTEAWHTGDKNLTAMTIEETDLSLSLKQFNKNISYAQKTGADEIYLWGVEWWYFMKEKKDYDGFWQEAKKLWP